MSLKCYFGIHSWIGCKCIKCGKTRNEQHIYWKDSDICRRCGKIKNDLNGRTFNPGLDKIYILLKCGYKVSVKRFTYHLTYWSLLDGIPDKRLNKEIIERENCPNDWGSENLSQCAFKIQPTDDEVSTFLPPSVFKVWLISNEPINNYDDASELVVIWFGENPIKRTIEEIIEGKIKDIDWKKYAQSFSY